MNKNTGARMICLILLGLLCDCQKQSSPTLLSASPAVPALLSLEPASPEDCDTGGALLLTYKDLNFDSRYDAGDQVLTSTKICNGSAGTAGSPGVGTGIAVSSASPEACPAGGSVLASYQDRNGNGLWDQGELLSSQTTVCNGSNGMNPRFSAMEASFTECPAGGTVFVSQSSQDQSPQRSVVCNGVNGNSGQDAKFLMGAVGPAVSGKSYSACHHDYLYFPDPQGGNRGWLTFRHQGNGSADEGIGSTGFQIWNVDVANFLLVSEVGATPYCSLQFDANARTLTYQVLDNSDGLGGFSGTLRF